MYADKMITNLKLQIVKELFALLLTVYIICMWSYIAFQAKPLKWSSFDLNTRSENNCCT